MVGWAFYVESMPLMHAGWCGVGGDGKIELPNGTKTCATGHRESKLSVQRRGVGDRALLMVGDGDGYRRRDSLGQVPKGTFEVE